MSHYFRGAPEHPDAVCFALWFASFCPGCLTTQTDRSRPLFKLGHVLHLAVEQWRGIDLMCLVVAQNITEQAGRRISRHKEGGQRREQCQADD